MPWMLRRLTVAAAIAVLLACRIGLADDGTSGWRPHPAGKYLDERATAWFAFDVRGEGATRSTCVSCHTVLPYILARPVLRTFVAATTPTEHETRLLAQTRLRVEHWPDLDSEAFGLFYNDSDTKKQQSWGTEAVFNALILAFDDRNQGRSSPSDSTQRAFSNLWATQLQTGEQKGSWDWLDFNEPPWGSADARYFGATLAAIAVRTAPGYYTPGSDAELDAKIELLKGYLAGRFEKESLHNQTWVLWAAASIPGILTTPQREVPRVAGFVEAQRRHAAGDRLRRLRNRPGLARPADRRGLEPKRADRQGAGMAEKQSNCRRRMARRLGREAARSREPCRPVHVGCGDRLCHSRTQPLMAERPCR